ncbi:hypothetical protein [Spirulina major]|uniref:hypothetical protein n=1 Tax=Spirulina major TaxID=270636 RepID=UPI000933B39F|nr:hypothetical protein [Spirulina major]
MSPLPRYPALINSSIIGLAASTLASREILHRHVEQTCDCDDDQDSSTQLASLHRFAAKVRTNPLLLEKLGRRVYELLEADLQYQRERNWTYGKR